MSLTRFKLKDFLAAKYKATVPFIEAPAPGPFTTRSSCSDSQCITRGERHSDSITVVHNTKIVEQAHRLPSFRFGNGSRRPTNEKIFPNLACEGNLTAAQPQTEPTPSGSERHCDKGNGSVLGSVLSIRYSRAYEAPFTCEEIINYLGLTPNDPVPLAAPVPTANVSPAASASPISSPSS